MPGNYVIGVAGPIELGRLAPYLDQGPFESGLVPRGLGGTPVVNLVLGLLERGCKLVVFTLDPDVKREMVLEGPFLRVCVGPYRSGGRARDGFAEEKKYLARAFEREAPDLIHAHWTYEFALPAVFGRIPHVVTAHDAPIRVLRFDPSPYRMVRTVMAGVAVKRTRNLVAVSPYIARHLQRWFRYSREIAVVPNGLAPELFRLGAARLANGRQSATVTFGCVLNGWNGLKNGATLLQAFQILRRTLPNVRLLMFGAEYGVGESAERWAKLHGLTTAVQFLGQLDPQQLWGVICDQVDVLVHPSREESFSMAIAEAMALGLPVIGGEASGAVPWTLGDGVAGRLVDVSSPIRLATIMGQLAVNPSERLHLGAAAHMSAKRRFDSAVVAKTYEAIYHRILHSGSLPDDSLTL